MLDTLELISLGVDYETVAKIASDDLLLEVELKRISPIQACVARDCIQRYTSEDFDFYALLPGNTFLKPRKEKPVMLEKVIDEPN